MNDLIELLQVGYIVKRRREYDLCVGEDITQNRKKFYNEDLTHTTHESFDIMEIRRPTSEHGKPVEWITVWKREEPKYWLIVKDTTVAKAIGNGCLNYRKSEDDYIFLGPLESVDLQTKFTRSEIKQIPQALRDLCVEIEVTNVTSKKGEGK